MPDALRTYRGRDCVEEFVKHIQDEACRLYKIFPKKPMDKLTQDEWKSFNSAKACHICLGDFYCLGDKVRDHCHYTGRYRGAAHSKCNLKYSIPNFIPIVFHNLSKYDSHLFIRELARVFNKEDIGCIAENKEKYISFYVKINIPIGDSGYYKKVQLRFIDSLRFMQSSLDGLSSNLVDLQCGNLRRYYGCKEKFSLMRRKGVYPYEYMSNESRFSETSLPPKEKFYSMLNMQGISDADYEHAKNVWNALGISNMGEYHDEYLKTDVLLLADVFENFRGACMKHYRLDPAHFYTAPGLAWQAALKITGVKLELLTDVDMLLMFERGIRGGIVQVCHRYAEANNKYMGGRYDSEKDSVFLQYLDANNLYGWAMSQSLPTHGFEWVGDLSVFTADGIGGICKDEDVGYLLEVDVGYCSELHDMHNGLPFLSEQMDIAGVRKLVPNLFDKERYVVHIRVLDQALKHGLLLKEVHRVIKFNQSPWLKPYIDLNTSLRISATSDFEKDFFKLMNNSVFGKTMENVRKHRYIKLVTNEKSYLRYVAKPNFESSIIFSEGFTGVEMGKTCVKMNKPVYLGQVILDLSKLVMYEFHYDYMVPKYGDCLKLCYMDTDSFVYSIETQDFYTDIAEDVGDRFDTSSYCCAVGNGSRPLPIGVNKKVIGLMKDELGGKVMTEFVALRPKLYAYRVLGDVVERKRCKGIKRCVVRESLSVKDYRDCLFGGGCVYRSQMSIQSRGHVVCSEVVNKIALSGDDDKRIVCGCGICSLARGHCRLGGGGGGGGG